MRFLEFPRAKRTGRIGPAKGTAAEAPTELERGEFTQWLDGPLQETAGSEAAFALLVVNLRRSDRTAAMMQRPRAQACDAEVASRVAEALRPQDRFTRVGPEHLVLVLPRINDAAVAMLAANRILGNFEAPIEIGGERIRMRPCVGCALAAANAAVDVDALVSAADRACVVAGSSESGFAMAAGAASVANDAGEVLEDFQAALRANELEVWFQPQQDIATGECLAAEALLRWRNKRCDRMISPALLVEMAEKHAMMTPLTTFVLNTALRQMSELRRAGIDLRVAVNASPSQLRDVELPDLVASALGTWEIPADRLTLEVTESAIMVDVEQSLRVMHDLKRQGVRLSVDDFGTGYSSLAYLQRMPLDELKIDMTFVQNMLENRADEQIVRSVIDLAHNFELEAIAEGVERRATLEMLASLGCDGIQGYLYARPMPSAQVATWWATRSDAPGR